VAKKEVLVFSFLLLVGPCASADKNQTFGPIQMQLPDQWSCKNETESLICLDSSPTSKKNAAIVINFKTRTPDDTLTIFHDQLSRPRVLQGGEVNSPSTPLGVNYKQIRGIQWVEGIHQDSEIKNFMTHYYATVVGARAILISLTIQLADYQEVLNKMNPYIETITVQTNPETSAPAGSAARNENTFSLPKQVEIFGYSTNIKFIYLGGALIAAILLLGYAIFSK